MKWPKALDLSRAHFAQMFRLSTGESAHQFVLRRRVERTKEMLEVSHTRLLDVAIACGFKTKQHFARVFRRFVAPAQQHIGKTCCARRTKCPHRLEGGLSSVAGTDSCPASS